MVFFRPFDKYDTIRSTNSIIFRILITQDASTHPLPPQGRRRIYALRRFGEHDRYANQAYWERESERRPFHSRKETKKKGRRPRREEKHVFESIARQAPCVYYVEVHDRIVASLRYRLDADFVFRSFFIPKRGNGRFYRRRKCATVASSDNAKIIKWPPIDVLIVFFIPPSTDVCERFKSNPRESAIITKPGRYRTKSPKKLTDFRRIGGNSLNGNKTASNRPKFRHLLPVI